MRSNLIAIEQYMLNKMEVKVSEIQQNRQLMININSLEDFNYHRNKLIQNMFDIEDEIRENFQLIKSTLTQKKDLEDQLENKKKTGFNSR